MVASIAFGKIGDWMSLVAGTIDAHSYTFECVDFNTYDMSYTDYAVPLTIQDARILHRRYGETSNKYIIPKAQVIVLCEDKKLFNESMLDSPYRHLIPPMYDRSDHKFPYVLKMRRESSGNGIFIIHDEQDEAAHRARLEGDGYFCQAFVPGKIEYATHMLLAEGELVYHSSNEYHMGAAFSVKGSATPPIWENIGVDVSPSVIATFVDLLRAVGFNGACCLDYKIVDDRIQLLEVNPRCGFSLHRDINRYLGAYTGALPPISAPRP